jgi:hypothetical protein
MPLLSLHYAIDSKVANYAIENMTSEGLGEIFEDDILRG